MTTTYQHLIKFITIALLAAGLYYLGYTKGQAKAEARYNQLQIVQLQTLITQSQTLNTQAQKLSINLERLLSTQAEENLQTTKELNSALNKTANTRVNCVLPTDVMQQLEASRRRAANAAITSNINNSLPATRSNDKQHGR